MEISLMLLKRKTDQLCQDYIALAQEVAKYQFQDAREFRVAIQAKLEEVSILNSTVENRDQISGDFTVDDLEDNFRLLKKAHHAASKQWLLIRSKNVKDVPKQQSSLAA